MSRARKNEPSKAGRETAPSDPKGQGSSTSTTESNQDGTEDPTKEGDHRKKRRRRPKAVTSPGEDRRRASNAASAEARQVASVVLEVLGGAIGPGEAATRLGRTSTQYYKLEARALEGLLMACEPRVRGRQRNPEKELESLAASHRKLERECSRLQALVRALGRASGVKRKAVPLAEKPSAGKSGVERGKTGKPTARKGKRGRRNPAVRALRLAEQLGENGQTPMPAGDGSVNSPASGMDQTR